MPKSNKNYLVKFGTTSETKSFSHYINSWRWIPLDDIVLKSLEQTKHIIYSDKNGLLSFAIVTDSDHFEKTLIVTFHSGSEENNHNLILYLQNFGFKNNYTRIQILTKDSLSEFENIEHRISFNLVRKFLD